MAERIELQGCGAALELGQGVRRRMKVLGGKRELALQGWCLPSGESTWAGQALSQGLGDVELRCYGVRLRELDRRGDLAPGSAWLQPGPWVHLVDALPYALQDMVPTGDRPEFRVLVARLLVNALGHRSLEDADRERPVRIERCSGGLRCVSPGPLVPEVKLVAGVPDDSAARNPSLLSLLSRATEHPEGRDLVTLAAHLGFRLRWTATETAVSATLERDRGFVEARPMRSQTPADQRAQLIVDALREHGSLSRRALQAHTGIKRTTLSKDLALLIQAGRVATTVEARRSNHQQYRLASERRR